MDLSGLAQLVAEALRPFLPLLLRIGDHAAEETGNRISAEGWALAKQLWARLGRRTSPDQELEQASREVVAVPADPVAQQSLLDALTDCLGTDPHLLQDVIRLLGVQPSQANTAGEINIGVQAGSISGGIVRGQGKSQSRI